MGKVKSWRELCLLISVHSRMPSMTEPATLAISNFAHIGKISLEFGDLTVLVGAQGTGKSLALAVAESRT
jgi:hypothetical protein